MATEDAVAVALRAACSALGAAAATAQTSSTNESAEGWAAWQERAAIRQYVGGLTPEDAERLTVAELGPCPPEPAWW